MRQTGEWRIFNAIWSPIDGLRPTGVEWTSRFGVTLLQADKAERFLKVPSAPTSSFCDTGRLSKSEEADRNVAERCHSLRPIALTNLATIFVEGHIAHPMQSVFDRPVAANQIEQPFR